MVIARIMKRNACEHRGARYDKEHAKLGASFKIIRIIR
jgi:hypothetical protein